MRELSHHEEAGKIDLSVFDLLFCLAFTFKEVIYKGFEE